MKKFIETIKDMLYDSIDYIIMIGIIGVVILVIGWRLDLLFAKDAFDLPPKNDTVVVDNKNKEDQSIIDNKDNEDESIIDNENNEDDPIDEIENEESKDDNQDNNSEEKPSHDSNDSVNESEDKVVKITIPAGSLPSKIGSILESNGLVSSKADFVQKLQEMKLDTKLKSGDYEIKANSTLEEIIKLISK